MSLGRCQYFVLFTDDWSRKVWVYFLKTKDEAFQRFVEWKKMVEVQVERKVKKLRTNNGLEFCNLRYDQFCRDEGIVRHRRNSLKCLLCKVKFRRMQRVLRRFLRQRLMVIISWQEIGQEKL